MSRKSSSKATARRERLREARRLAALKIAPSVVAAPEPAVTVAPALAPNIATPIMPTAGVVPVERREQAFARHAHLGRRNSAIRAGLWEGLSTIQK